VILVVVITKVHKLVYAPGVFQGKAMSTDYRIESVHNKFIVIDPWDEQVGVYPNEEAAQQDIERCKREDVPTIM